MTRSVSKLRYQWSRRRKTNPLESPRKYRIILVIQARFSYNTHGPSGESCHCDRSVNLFPLPTAGAITTRLSFTGKTARKRRRLAVSLVSPDFEYKACLCEQNIFDRWTHIVVRPSRRTEHALWTMFLKPLHGGWESVGRSYRSKNARRKIGLSNG